MLRRQILASSTSTTALFCSLLSSSRRHFYPSSSSASSTPSAYDQDQYGDPTGSGGGMFGSSSSSSYDDDPRSGGGGGGLDFLGQRSGKSREGYNPADFAQSGIHGPLAAVARRDTSESAGRYRLEFHGEKLSRCNLCAEPINSWAGHVVFVSHQCRLAIIERVLSGACGPPQHVVDRWWRLLNVDPEGAKLPRIRELSSDNSEERRKRLIYCLQFLQGNGVLKVALGVYNEDTMQLGRSNVFERFEMVGDNVVKAVFFDRLQHLFPVSDGGAAGKMAMIQQLIDSNEGLLQAFDYLELDKIIGSGLAQSKFKSDVIEALFGELQSYLWAVPQQWGSSPVEYPPINPAAGPEMKYLEPLVRHTLLELTDVILMFAVESTVNRAKKVIEAEYKGSREEKPLPHEMMRWRRMRTTTAKNMNRGRDADGIGGEGGPMSHHSDGFFVASGKYDTKPFIAFDPHSRAAVDEAFAQAQIASAAASSMKSSNFDIGVSVIKPLAQRLAEERQKQLQREAAWRVPVPLFVVSDQQQQQPASLEAATIAHIEFTELCVDAALELPQREENNNSNGENINSHGMYQRPARLSHVEDYARDELLACGAILFPLFASQRLSSVPEAKSSRRDKQQQQQHQMMMSDPFSVSWQHFFSTACPWSPLAPRLTSSLTALAPQPPLEVLPHISPNNTCVDGDTNNDDDGDEAADQRRAVALRLRKEIGYSDETDVVDPTPDEQRAKLQLELHRDCAADALLDLTRAPNATDVHDFSLSQLRPVLGRVRFDLL